MKPQEFKEIKTPRMVLKPHVATFDFAKVLFDIIDKNRDFFKYMPWFDVKNAEQEFDFLRDSEKGWKNKTKANYAMFAKNEFVGCCSFFGINWNNESGEIGYWLNPKFANQGFMTEATSAIADEFFNMGFQRITILANPENIASCRVAEKCGFTREGIMRSYDFLPAFKVREDVALYAKVK